MTAFLAVAVLAEHLSTGDGLATVVGRLGREDRANLPGEVAELATAVAALRDVVQTRNPVPDRPGRVTRGRTDPPPPRVNRFPGQCRCGRKVAAGQGWAVKTGTRWAVECQTCRAEDVKRSEG